MISRFRSVMESFKDGGFERPHTKEPGAQKVMISKEDTYCGGHPQPTYFVTFVVADAAPVDVFNVLAQTLHQPEWLCKGCIIKLVDNDVKEQVQGFAATYNAFPLAPREFYQWQAYDVNLTSEEFLVGVTGRDNQELHRLQVQEPTATVGRMCYAFSHITRHPAGTLVQQFSHFDARVSFQIGPLSPRNFYRLIWAFMLERVPRIIARAQQQAALNWDAQRLAVPAVFLGLNDSSDSANFVPLPNVTRGAPAYAASASSAAQLHGPLIIVALVVVALCCCCMLCGLLVLCGVCQVPGKASGGSCWEPIDEDGQPEEEEEEEEWEWEYEE